MTVFHSKKFVRSACSRNLKEENEKTEQTRANFQRLAFSPGPQRRIHNVYGERCIADQTVRRQVERHETLTVERLQGKFLRHFLWEFCSVFIVCAARTLLCPGYIKIEILFILGSARGACA